MCGQTQRDVVLLGASTSIHFLGGSSRTLGHRGRTFYEIEDISYSKIITKKPDKIFYRKIGYYGGVRDITCGSSTENVHGKFCGFKPRVENAWFAGGGSVDASDDFILCPGSDDAGVALDIVDRIQDRNQFISSNYNRNRKNKSAKESTDFKPGE